MGRYVFDRRQFLAMSTVAAGAALVGTALIDAGGSVAGASQRWSDPNTWGGTVPRPGTWVSIDRPILLDQDVSVKGLAIQPGGVLTFDPSRSITLTSTSNLVVNGTLQMRPASAKVRHTVRFTGIDESAFVGGGMSVLETDVGLWCLGQGILDLAGTPKRAWARAQGSIGAGATQVTLQADPVGWRVGDEIVITPTAGPDTSNHHDAYDSATITAVAGRTITLSRRTTHSHPATDVGNGVVVSAEVLNLTRNVNLEGTANGRSHVFIMAKQRQHLAYFACRWMAPRRPEGGFTDDVLGRYALHFHMGYDGTRGSKVIGGVVRDAGGHAFVPHLSHGIEFASCISHDTYDEAYWWDGAPDTRTAADASHDITFRACVASRVKSDPPFRGYRLAGFILGAGDRNVAIDCVAVGVQGNVDAAGFIWPEMKNTAVWTFQRCVTHNNAVNGMFTWQNTDHAHVVEDFVSYHNGTAGIAHGAYLTSYLYRNGYLYGNGRSAIDLHSNSFSEVPQRFHGLYCEGAGHADHAVRVLKHTLAPGRPSEFVACRFSGFRKSAIGLTYTGSNGSSTPELFDVVDCITTAPMLWMGSVQSGSRVRVQSGQAAVAATPIGTPGTFVPEWNASVNQIPSFTPFARSGTTRYLTLASASGIEVESPPRTDTRPTPGGLQPATRLKLGGG